MANIVDFIEDGHKVYIGWDRDQLHITHVECPHSGKVGMCNRLRDFCVVSRFIGVYGSECNIGSVSVNGPIEVAWYPVPGRSDLDEEFKQVWIIPVDDPDYIGARFAEDQKQLTVLDEENPEE